MNPQKFTQKSLESIQQAQDLALSKGSMQIEQEHLLAALLRQENGLIPQLFVKMGVDPQAFDQELDQAIGRIPSVSGPGRESGKIYVAQDVDRVLNDAENQAARMKDDYVSVEHIFLALMANPNSGVKKLLSLYSIDQNRFLTALSTVRGSAG